MDRLTRRAALAASGHGPAINTNSLLGTTGAFGAPHACHAAQGAVRTLGTAGIAAGVAYLACDDASFITGAGLYIDGGYLAP
ncbi:MAG: SDR family oxidoreductase [Streptosporangiaceae bacterium]